MLGDRTLTGGIRLDKDISIIGQSREDTVLRNPDGAAITLSGDLGSRARVSIEDVTIRDSEIGISVAESANLDMLRLERITLTENTGTGILVRGGDGDGTIDTVMIRDLAFEANGSAEAAGETGDLRFVDFHGAIDLRDTVFTGNGEGDTALSIDGRGLPLASVILRDSEIGGSYRDVPFEVTGFSGIAPLEPLAVSVTADSTQRGLSVALDGIIGDYDFTQSGISVADGADPVALRGGGDQNRIASGPEAAELSGGEGDDALLGGGGDDTLDGGSGIDAALFSGDAAGYSVAVETGTITVTDTDAADGDEGTDRITRTERLVFDDRTVTALIGEDDLTVAANATVSGNLLANDADLDDDGLEILDVLGDPSLLGTDIVLGDGVTINIAANGDYTLTAGNALPAGSTLAEEVTFLIDTGDGFRETGTASVTVAGANTPPELTEPVADAVASAGQPFLLDLPDTLFADPDEGDMLTVTATRADGGALPAWLGFDPATLAFSGTPEEADLGSLAIRLTATDGAGAAATADFTLDVGAGDLFAGADGIAADDAVDVGTGTVAAFERVTPDGRAAVTGTATDRDTGAEVTVTALDPLPAGAQRSDTDPRTALADLDIGGTARVSLPDGLGGVLTARGATDEAALRVQVARALGRAAEDALVASVAALLLSPDAGGETGGTDGIATLTLTGSTGETPTVAPSGDNLLTVLDTTAAAAPDYAFEGEVAAILRGAGFFAPADPAASGDDIAIGDDTAQTLSFGAGDDTVLGLGGNDQLVGGDGDDALEGNAGNDTLEGGDGADLLDGGEGDDLLIAGAGADTLMGGAGQDSLFGGAGDDALSGGNGDDELSGGEGDDLLDGGAGNDAISGGEGIDTALYALRRDALTETVDPDGSVTVVTADGTDTLDGVERIALDDGAYLYDLGPDAPFVHRLYSALLGRDPAEGGLRFWLGRFEDTGDEDALARAFVDSAEFARNYPGADADSETFVTALFEVALGRPPAQTGLEFWSGVIDTGDVTRADMLLFFSESPESIRNTADDYDDGVWVIG